MDTVTRGRAATAAPQSPRRSAAGRLKRRADTPRLLGALALASGLLVAVLAAFLAAAAGSARGDLNATASGADGVDAANDLYFRLTDMDAQAADILLVGFHPAVPPAVTAADSQHSYDADRAAVSADLQRIAADPAAAGTYAALLTSLGGYESLIGQALYADAQDPDQQPATPPAAALRLYEQASASMHDSILPAAHHLTEVSSAQVDGMYEGDHAALDRDAWSALLIAVGVAAAYAAVHGFISARFRRVLSPALALAAAGTLVVGGAACAMFHREADDLHTAKVEAFDSISALTDARAVSYDANAAESRWLLDRSSALQRAFFTDVAQIAPVGALSAAMAADDPDLYYAALQQTLGELHLDAAANTVTPAADSSAPPLGGFLGTELGNITFPGEAAAAYRAALAFNSYIQLDATLRTDGERGELSQAVAVDIGLSPGQSNYAFGQYDAALQHVIGINQDAFNTAVAAGAASLSPWSWLPYATALVLLALLAAGTAPRLREFR